MPRRSSVRYWPSRKAYCCWFNKQQQVLAEGPDDFPNGPTYQEALGKFGQLTSRAGAPPAKDRNPARVVCESSPQWTPPRRNPRTLKLRKRIYVPFTDALGETMVKDLTHAV